MPDVSPVSALPDAASAPLATAASGGVAPVSRNAPVISFVAQLKSAFASAGRPRVAQRVPDQQRLPGDPATAIAVGPESPKHAEDDQDNLAELLAALGVIPGAALEPLAPKAAGADDHPGARANGSVTPAPTDQPTGGVSLPADLAAAVGAARAAPLPVDAAASEDSPPTPTGAHRAVATPHGPAAPTVQTAPAATGRSAFGQHASGEDEAADADRLANSGPGAAPSDDLRSIDGTIANATSTAGSTPPGTPLPAHPRPSEVVNQIAHQAELYRLPGNKGVRIQLHPEDLGGVDVTLRYSAGGGIQLHISVEHAATGQLVQSGWTELRDALATQGINPDRLVMSITAPNDASGLDFSNGNGSPRPDQGPASFGQGQSSAGGQRQNSDDNQPAVRGWQQVVETIPEPANDAFRGGPTASARIDYRA